MEQTTKQRVEIKRQKIKAKYWDYLMLSLQALIIIVFALALSGFGDDVQRYIGG